MLYALGLNSASLTTLSSSAMTVFRFTPSNLKKALEQKAEIFCATSILCMMKWMMLVLSVSPLLLLLGTVAAFRTPSSPPDNVDISTRRSFFSQSFLVAGGTTVSTAITLLRNPAITHAANTNTNNDDVSKLFEDINYGFRINIPASWEQSEQTLSGRRKAVFFTDPTSKNPETGNTIVTLGYVAYTPVRDDFTNLSSFGSVDEVGQATILPKELAGGDGSTSTMISAISANGAYYFDYIVSPTVPTTEVVDSSGSMTKLLKPQHFRSIFTLLPPIGRTSAGMTLVTLTLQTSEERYNDGECNVKGVFNKIINSYEKIK